MEADGSHLLCLPCADACELVMNTLQHMPEVQVIGPAGLPKVVEKMLRLALTRVTP